MWTVRGVVIVAITSATFAASGCLHDLFQVTPAEAFVPGSVTGYSVGVDELLVDVVNEHREREVRRRAFDSSEWLPALRLDGFHVHDATQAPGRQAWATAVTTYRIENRCILSESQIAIWNEFGEPPRLLDFRADYVESLAWVNADTILFVAGENKWCDAPPPFQLTSYGVYSINPAGGQGALESGALGTSVRSRFSYWNEGESLLLNANGPVVFHRASEEVVPLQAPPGLDDHRLITACISRDGEVIAADFEEESYQYAVAVWGVASNDLTIFPERAASSPCYVPETDTIFFLRDVKASARGSLWSIPMATGDSSKVV